MKRRIVNTVETQLCMNRKVNVLILNVNLQNPQNPASIDHEAGKYYDIRRNRKASLHYGTSSFLIFALLMYPSVIDSYLTSALTYIYCPL